jgi:hypothetical protein
MSVTNVCFCRDHDNNFGLVRGYKHGLLLVTFDDGDRWVKPTDLTFI